VNHEAVHAGMFKESTMQMQLAAFREIAPARPTQHRRAQPAV